MKKRGSPFAVLLVAIFLMTNFCACNNQESDKSEDSSRTGGTSASSQTEATIGRGDQTGYWYGINVMLKRPDNWKKMTDLPDLSIDLNRVDGSTATIPITVELLRQFNDASDDQFMIYIEDPTWRIHYTTHNAYLSLIDKDGKGGYDASSWVDIIFVTPPSDEELQYAEEKGVVLDQKPVAMDGFVFITHKDNPIDSLTVEQIQDIYSGKITNWKDVGGQDQPISAYQREPNSGSQTAMENLVMQGKPLVEPINTLISGMDGLVDAVAEYKNGPASIGYTYSYYINNLYKSDDIKVLKINGITPENQNLKSGAYPFTTSYYAIIRDDEPEDSPARKLRDFLLTDKGQEIIQLAGYCSVEGVQ